ncbi:metallopeptidase family protein [Myxococcota bacterium]|nr:metallopeptidase family protein [Myxococcota bacterium]
MLKVNLGQGPPPPDLQQRVMKSNDRYWDCLDQAMEASHGGRTEEALAWLDEALRAHPEGAEAHNGRGEILWDDGRVEEALHEFERSLGADPKFVTAHLNRIELLIEDLGEFDHAVRMCDTLLAGNPDLPRLDRGTEAEVHYLKAKAVFYLDDLQGAIFLVRRALKTSGEVAIYRAFEGQILFELANFEEARRALEMAAHLDPEASHSIYHLGLVLERLGEDDSAWQAFERAHALDPDHYALPTAVTESFFREATGEALDNLPRSIREWIAAVPVLIEDAPSPELLAQENVSPQILGIYIGTPRTVAGVNDASDDITRIVLFKKNLEKLCRDRNELIEQIQITVRHEVGHHLGLSEADLDRLGLG